MEQATRKIGQNRGKPRLWIEGKILTAAGFTPGDRYDFRPIMKNPPVWAIERNPDGARKVSGKGEKPIIDISGKAVPEGTSVTLTVLCRGGIRVEANQ